MSANERMAMIRRHMEGSSAIKKEETGDSGTDDR